MDEAALDPSTEPSPIPARSIVQAICLGCQVVRPDLQTCAGCHGAFYCSPSCQKLDWPRHRQDCRELASRINGPLDQREAIAISHSYLVKFLPRVVALMKTTPPPLVVYIEIAQVEVKGGKVVSSGVGVLATCATSPVTRAENLEATCPGLASKLDRAIKAFGPDLVYCCFVLRGTRLDQQGQGFTLNGVNAARCG